MNPTPKSFTDTDRLNARIKEQADKAYFGVTTAPQTPTGFGTLGSGSALGGPCRAGLRERVALDRQSAGRSAEKLERLRELESLLDRFPEIARILDLIEEVRG